MTFAEALPYFCDQFCRERAARGEPVMLSEFSKALTLMLVWTLESVTDLEAREVLRTAIRAALEADPEPTSIDKRGMH